jgi:septal ring factor EnvC (AmiA/AmiB activator)
VADDNNLEALQRLYEQQRRELEQLDRQLADLTARWHETRARARQFATMLTEHGHPPATELPTSPGRSGAARRRRPTRAQAVLDVLQAADQPLSPRQVAERLQASGRDDTPRLVNATLAHLRRQDRARRTGPATWQATPPPT